MSLNESTDLSTPEKSFDSLNFVFLHGWGMNRLVWSPVVTSLEQRGIEASRLHSFDLPGFGDNQTTSQRYQVEHLAEYFSDVIPENSILVGWSMGGLIAKALSLHQKEKVSGLVSVASTPRFAEGKSWKGIKNNVLDGFSNALVDDLEGTIKRFIALQNIGMQNSRLHSRALQDLILSAPTPSKSTLLDSLNLLKTADLRNQITSIDVPTLVVLGRLDSLVPVSIADYYSETLPNAEVVIMKKASHAPFLTHTESFCDALINFSKKV